jgi:hypothetical protein
VHLVQPHGFGGSEPTGSGALAIGSRFAAGVGVAAVVVDLLGRVTVVPNENGVVVPARQAYSHSASLGSAGVQPLQRRFNSAMKRCASCQATFSTGFCAVILQNGSG